MRDLFPIATLEEIQQARRELGWPTWKKDIERLVNIEDKYYWHLPTIQDNDL